MEWFEKIDVSQIPKFVFVAGIVVVVLILAYCLFFRKKQLQKYPRKAGMWGFTLIYADQKHGGKKQENFGKLLYSETYDLQGKPDYVFRRIGGKTIVPVELKSGAIGMDKLPHKGDYMQLAAYFLLLEDVYGIRPKYGWLKYRDYMFFVRNTRKVRKEVKRTMAEMRRMLYDGKGTPQASYAHCRPCVCSATVCPYSQYHRNGEKA